MKLKQYEVVNVSGAGVLLWGVNAAHALSQYLDRVRRTIQSNRIPKPYKPESVKRVTLP